MNIIQRLWQKYSPDFLLDFIRFILEPRDYKTRRKAVLEKFRKLDQDKLVPEIREGLRYLKNHKYTPFPYNWAHKYDRVLPEVFYDKENRIFYILFEGKKMYFPRSFSMTHVIWNVRRLLKEQDMQSPHLYLNDGFLVEPGSVVIDAGVAEGNFALSVIDEAQRVYLVECDKEWMEALKLTFDPWKDKVVFIEKYMSDIESETTICLDSLMIPEPGFSYFIKLDIEGFEQKALSGMKRMVISGDQIKMDVCTYHRLNDYNEIEATLLAYGFTCRGSDGFVLYSETGEEPTFRKALIRAEKK